MSTLPTSPLDERARSRRLLGGLFAASAMAALTLGTPAAAQTQAKAAEAGAQEAAVCMLAGVEVPKAEDADCPMDVLSTLRAYRIPYEAPKLDENGNPVIDAETGEAVMEAKAETFSLMAELLEATGLGDALQSTPGTVFALPDSVLTPVVAVLSEAMKNEEMRDAVMAELAAAAGSHALNEPMAKSAFQNANGKVWTLAGGWQTAAPPLSFYALSGDGSVKVNGVMLDGTVTAPDGSVIHIIASPLVALPQPAMKMADAEMAKSG